MNLKRYIWATVALFVFIFFYEWLVHGVLLMDIYEQTPQVWRDFSQMEANMPIAMLFQLAFAGWTAFVFTRLFPDGGVSNGLWYGLYVGVFVSIITANWYLWLPVSSQLAWSWFAAGIVKGLGAGFIIGSIYRR